MGSNGKVDDLQKVQIVCEQCVIFRDNALGLYPESYTNRIALAVYKHCVMPRLRAKTRRSNAAARPRKVSAAVWNEIRATQNRLTRREELVAGRERELQYYETQSRIARQTLSNLQLEIQKAQTDKKALERAIADLKQGFVFAIGPEHLKQLSPQLLYTALGEVMSPVIALNQRAHRNFRNVMDAMGALVRLFGAILQQQELTKRQR